MSHNTAAPDGKPGKLLPPELLSIQFYQSTSSWERRTIRCFSQLTHANNSAHHGHLLPILFREGRKDECPHGFPMSISLSASIRPISGQCLFMCIHAHDLTHLTVVGPYYKCTFISHYSTISLISRSCINSRGMVIYVGKKQTPSSAIEVLKGTILKKELW